MTAKSSLHSRAGSQLVLWSAVGVIYRKPKPRKLPNAASTLLTPTRKNMRHLAPHFQLTCPQLHHRGEEVFAVLQTAFDIVRTTHRAAYALPIHLLGCLLAYLLSKSLIV